MAKLSMKVEAVLWSTEVTDVRSILVGRRWAEWIGHHVQGATEVSGESKQQLLQDLRRLRLQFGPARAFEHDGVVFSDFLSEFLASLQACSIACIYVVIGDSEAPAVFRMPFDDLQLVLREAGRQEATVVLAFDSIGGIISVDPPNPEKRVDTLLVSAVGALTPVIDRCNRRLPGGFQFNGN